jgi:hypothetical protein
MCFNKGLFMTTPAKATVQLKKLMSDFSYGYCALDHFKTSVIALAKEL